MFSTTYGQRPSTLGQKTTDCILAVVYRTKYTACCRTEREDADRWTVYRQLGPTTSNSTV
jgi:hypothetical protein